ncbi:MAG: hypothetical protein WCG05_03610 [Alphaproteobacteria bacterium]
MYTKFLYIILLGLIVTQQAYSAGSGALPEDQSVSHGETPKLIDPIQSEGLYLVLSNDDQRTYSEYIELGRVLRSSHNPIDVYAERADQVLTITQKEYPPADQSPLLKLLPFFVNLKTLSLRAFYSGVSGDRTVKVKELESILGILPSLSQLEVLRLESFYISDDHAKSLVNALAKMHNLQDLQLCWNDIDIAGVEAITGVLPQMPNLLGLTLWDNDIDAARVEALAVPISKMPSLKRLNLAGGEIGTTGVEALPQMFSLRNLQLRYNICATDSKVLADALVKMTGLQILGVRDNKIGDAGVEVLAKILPQMLNLENLDLEGNNIGNTGVEALVGVLDKMPKLQRLSLEDNEIGDAGAEALLKIIPTLTQLQVLVLCESKIKDALKIQLKACERRGLQICV